MEGKELSNKHSIKALIDTIAWPRMRTDKSNINIYTTLTSKNCSIMSFDHKKRFISFPTNMQKSMTKFFVMS